MSDIFLLFFSLSRCRIEESSSRSRAKSERFAENVSYRADAFSRCSRGVMSHWKNSRASSTTVILSRETPGGETDDRSDLDLWTAHHARFAREVPSINPGLRLTGAATAPATPRNSRCIVHRRSLNPDAARRIIY